MFRLWVSNITVMISNLLNNWKPRGPQTSVYFQWPPGFDSYDILLFKSFVTKEWRATKISILWVVYNFHVKVKKKLTLIYSFFPIVFVSVNPNLFFYIANTILYRLEWMFNRSQYYIEVNHNIWGNHNTQHCISYISVDDTRLWYNATTSGFLRISSYVQIRHHAYQL